MRVELRNIGPINRASVDLSGFALLVGPNASGKTTLSTVCYSVLIAHGAAELAVARLTYARVRPDDAREMLLDGDRIVQRFASTFRAALADQLQRCFNPNLTMLPRRGRAGNGSAPRIMVSDDPPDDDPWKMVFLIRDGALVLETRHPEYSPRQFRPIVDAETVEDRQMGLRRRRGMGRVADPVYFPAARSGYVQMQNVIAKLLVAALGRGLYGDISIGKISGVASDFLQFIAGLDPGKEARIPEAVCERLEEELIHGHLRLRPSETAPIIEFSPFGTNEYWQMDIAATSIAEVAPLLLYLRHHASPRDLLFIDEPEAHLHPENQLVLASVLLELSGLIRGMVVGTHSEFFATGISNGLLKRSADGTGGADVTPYELVRDRSTGGYSTETWIADPRSGFAVRQFNAVADTAVDEAEALFVRAQAGD